MSTKHTPGPWRWEFNGQNKRLQLAGGVPTFDLTVMDFTRWGMGGACVRLREDVDGMNIMVRLADKQEWIAAFPDRPHHANWCADVTHPDMRLIAAAPELLEFAELVVRGIESGHIKAKPFLDMNALVGDSIPMRTIGVAAREVIAKATGEKA